MLNQLSMLSSTKTLQLWHDYILASIASLQLVSLDHFSSFLGLLSNKPSYQQYLLVNTRKICSFKHTWFSDSHQRTLFKPKTLFTVQLYQSNMYNVPLAILMVSVSFNLLVFMVSTVVCSTCDVMNKMEETVNVNVAYFMHSKTCTNSVLPFHCSQQITSLNTLLPLHHAHIGFVIQFTNQLIYSVVDVVWFFVLYSQFSLFIIRVVVLCIQQHSVTLKTHSQTLIP